MDERTIFAGFGGQGILTMGKLLAACAMQEGRHVTYFPAYGSEVRGGTAHSQVVIGDEPIASPLVEEATALVVMNEPSLNRFLPQLGAGGLLMLNTTLIETMRTVDSADVLEIPATELANDIGDVRVANMIMLSALVEVRELVAHEVLHDMLVAALRGRREATIPANEAALEKGRELATAWMKK